MQLVSQPRNSIISQLIKIVLNTGMIIFAVLLVMAFGYGLYASLTTDDFPVVVSIMQPFIIGIPFVLGWLIDKKHPGHIIALLFLLMAYSSAAGLIAGAIAHFNRVNPLPYADLINASALTIGHIMWLPGVFFPLYIMPLYFPNGKLLSPLWLWRIPVITSLSQILWWSVGTIFRPWPWELYGVPDTRTPNGIAGSEAFFDTVSTILTVPTAAIFLWVPLAMFLRYRRADNVVREQIKYPIFAIVILVFVFLTFWAFPDFGALDEQHGYPFTWTIAMLFPISIGVAILRHNLFDIDVIINRTLVYGVLTMLIIVLYVTIVSLLGVLVQTQTSVLSGLIAAGIVAVIFQPLRERLQKIVNRLLYGERDEPALVLSRLAYHLETADTPASILPNLVQSIADTLKIPYVAIWLPTEEDNMEVVAECGHAPEQREMISLVYQNNTIGYLVVAPRSNNERFNSDERKLLATIASLTASTVHAVDLSDELRQSRQRIVTAREEERRRIRRDLHDGLGPQLASQTLGLEAIAQLMPINPEKALSLIESLQTQAHEAIHDVRRLVYDLRPPALDDLGLVGALKQSVFRYESSQLKFSFDISDMQSHLPAAVEIAAFRIALEAITNVVRHANASHCIVRLHRMETELLLEIEDDGCGLPEDYHSGIGLEAMRERAAELNGETVIDMLPNGGTCVRTHLPLEVYRE